MNVLNTVNLQVGDKFHEFVYENCEFEKHSAKLTFNNTIENKVMQKYWYPNINEGDIVIDAGASFGLYTLPALCLGAKVHAFEPHPVLNKTLVNNVRLNKFESKCQCLKVGLDEFVGTVAYNDKVLSMYVEPTHSFIDVISLDKFVSIQPDIDRIDLIKIDVDGNELQLIRGARAALRKFKPKLLIETHDAIIPDSGDRVLLQLRQSDFNMKVDTVNYQRNYMYIEFV